VPLRRALPVLAGVLVLAGCGAKRTPPDPPPVRLTITAPADSATIDAESVRVTGTVSPARASVQVLGRPAPVTGGSFSIDVPLQEGMNVVDVAASARGRSPALAALRLRRDTRVAVPDVTGEDRDTAAAQLDQLGLSVQEDRGGGFLDPLLPGPWRVCATDPAAGAKLPRGGTVTLETAKRC
jgi:hypothetical protein